MIDGLFLAESLSVKRGNYVPAAGGGGEEVVELPEDMPATAKTPFPWWWILIAAVVIVAAIVILLVILRKRSKKDQEA